MGSNEIDSVFNNVGEIIAIVIALVVASLFVGGVATVHLSPFRPYRRAMEPLTSYNRTGNYSMHP